jgi:competence protein ComEC
VGLVLPHYGSRTSSSDAFVHAVSSHVAVYSVPRDSRFGHPHSAVVVRYRALCASVLRTDEQGAITIRTDGQSVWIEPYSGGSGVLSLPGTHRLAGTFTPPSAAPR